MREISLYPGLSEEQLLRFHPGKEGKIPTILRHLLRQGRIQRTESGCFLPQGFPENKLNPNLRKAVWVLLDFLDQAEFHSASDFPVQLVFFRDGTVYEVVHVPLGQETLMTQALKLQRENLSRRIVIVESTGQISQLDIPNTAAFCFVTVEGRVLYYQKRKEDS